jgi:predicted nucleotidyltransferase
MQTPLQIHCLEDQPQLSRQYELLRRLQSALSQDDRCLGAAVGGSLAESRGDRLSDVDLLVYCEAGAARELLQKLSEVAADKPVVHRLNGQHDASSVYEKVILDDWSSYELHVVEPSTRMRLAPPYVEVINRGDYLASRVDAQKQIGRSTVKPLSSGEDGLMWELFNCMKWLRRGELDVATQYLQSLGNALAHRASSSEA